MSRLGALECVLYDGARRRTGGAAGGLCLSVRRQAAQCARARREPAEVARLPVAPGNSDLCFEWIGPIADAVAHLKRCGVAHRERSDAALRRQRRGHQRLFPRSRRLADGIHVVSRHRRRRRMAEAPGTHDPTIPAARHSGAAGRRRRAASDRPETARPGAAGNRRRGRQSFEAQGPHRALRLSAHRRAWVDLPAGWDEFRARAAARRNPAGSATISPSSRRSAWHGSSAFRPRTPPISARPPSGCICRSRSCRTPKLAFTSAIGLPTFVDIRHDAAQAHGAGHRRRHDREGVLSGVPARQERCRTGGLAARSIKS